MRVDIVTIFPEYLAPLDLSLLGRARGQGLLDVAVHDLRQWTYDVHRTVDDTPYGGGPGMVMRPEPWGEALDAVLTAAEPRSGEERAASSAAAQHTAAEPRSGEERAASSAAARQAAAEPAASPEGGRDALLVVPSPAGMPFTQAVAHELAHERHLVFACGRYEGIDERVLDHAATRVRVLEVSLGDYVLFGGEVAVLVILEAVGRLLPGVVGNAESLVEESHAAGLLEAPVYTKPPEFRGLPVPEVLRSGDHARIARWRRDQSLQRTARRRPDLIAALPPEALSKRDREALDRP